jgi:hypothetical protein
MAVGVSAGSVRLLPRNYPALLCAAFYNIVFPQRR